MNEEELLNEAQELLDELAQDVEDRFPTRAGRAATLAAKIRMLLNQWARTRKALKSVDTQYQQDKNRED